VSRALDLAEEALRAAEGDEAEVLVHAERSGVARFANSIVHQPTLVDDAMVRIRIVRDGKVGSVFTSSNTQHGGQETTITSFHTTLLHFGMVIVGLPYTYKDLSTMREVTGGTPYGASSITGAGAEFRFPSPLELDMCKYQGEHVTRITRDLVAGRAAAK